MILNEIKFGEQHIYYCNKNKVKCCVIGTHFSDGAYLVIEVLDENEDLTGKLLSSEADYLTCPAEDKAQEEDNSIFLIYREDKMSEELLAIRSNKNEAIDFCKYLAKTSVSHEVNQHTYDVEEVVIGKESLTLNDNLGWTSDFATAKLVFSCIVGDFDEQQ